MDYLHPKPDEMAVARMTSLALAHVGDAVYELMVRSYLTMQGTQTARELHKRTIQLVCASAQHESAEMVLPLLEEEEATVFRHGRNAKPKTIPRSATVAEYSYATALEALFGWLFLNQKYDRLNELFDIIAKGF